MANLLPPYKKEKLVREYYVRVISVFGIVFSVAGLMVVVMHIPIYVLIQSQINAMQAIVADAQEYQDTISDATETFSLVNQKVSILNQEHSQLLVHYIEKLEDLSGPQISITDLNLSRAEEVVSSVRLTAVAATRQDLISFRETISADPEFGTFEVPLANLSQPRDIEFTVQIPIEYVNNI